jgi:uncharacterized protein
MQPESISANGFDVPLAEFPPLAQPVEEASPTAITLEPLPAPPPAPAPAPKALPVQPQERVAAVDVLRGVALMGILAMNIVAFAWPEASYDNPRAGNNKSTTDLVVWAFNHVVFDEKMMTIFSMLFGAGLVLMSGRSEARGAKLAGVYYRRVFWLLVIGLIHAYFIWWGDILVLYASCGFLLYLFRRRQPRTLIATGLLCVLLPVILGTWFLVLVRMSNEYYWGIRGTPRVILSTIGDPINRQMAPDPARAMSRFEKEELAYRGSYWGIVRYRAPVLIKVQTLEFVFVTLYMVGGRMLIGMGLMKLGVFTGQKSRRLYLWMIGLGYGIGLPMVAYDTWLRISVDFHGAEMIASRIVWGYLSALAIAMGHIGLVMLIFQSGALQWLTRRLAAAGRMALSNYLMQSIICTTLFYGYGCCLFGTMNRLELWGVVLAIWVFQLATSIIWLNYFRYGPAEWVWRSLTYWKFQPMLAFAASPLPAAASEAITTDPTSSVGYFGEVDAGSFGRPEHDGE